MRQAYRGGEAGGAPLRRPLHPMPGTTGEHVRPLLFTLSVAAIVICDQVSKWAVSMKLPQGVRVPVLPRVLWLNFTRNTGGAFSVLQTHNAVFVGIAIVAIAALIYAYVRS